MMLGLIMRLLALLCALGAAPLGAQSAALALPDFPHLQEPLLYEVVFRNEGQAGKSSTKMVQQLTFGMVDNRPALTVETLEITTPMGSFSNTDEFVLPAGSFARVISLLSPISFQARENGVIERVLEWPEFQEIVGSGIETQAALLPPSQQEDFLGSAREALAILFSQGAEGATITLGDPWISFFGYFGREIVPGQRSERTIGYPIFGGQIEVPTTNSDLIEALPDGRIRIERKQHVDQAAFADAMADLAARNALELTDERMAELEAMAQTSRASVIEQIITADGILQKARFEVRITDPAGQLIEHSLVNAEKVEPTS